MKLTNPSGRREALSEINVTPLVDVMLVLLIIFMVAAPMMSRGIDIELPATRTAKEIGEERIVVSIARDGGLYINERPVHPELFADRIKQIAAGRPGEGIYLRADRDLAYGRVLGVMDQIRAAGVDRIAMVTTPVAEGAADGPGGTRAAPATNAPSPRRSRPR